MLLLLAFALFYPGAAAAQDTASTAARALSSDHVYVDADAEMAGRVDAGALRSRIGGEPIWIAVLPDNAGDPVSVARELRSDAGGEGAYGVIVGTQFRAGPGQDVAQAGNAAISAHPGDVQATLEDFVDRVKNGGGGGSGSGGSGISTGVVVVLLALLAGGGALLIGARRRTRRREAEELAEVRETARDDLVALVS